MTDTTSQETHLHNWLKTKRSEIENLLKRRYFFRPAFEIYGGVSGLYDYGPTGCSMKRELEDFWRRHFILEEDMLEFSGTNITPESVLQASGHVEKFSDFMVKEEGTGICFRADKYLEQFIEEKIKEANLTEEQKKELEIISNSADSYSAEELHQIYVRFEIKSPQGNSLSYPEPFNLMFSTMIGPTGTFKGYLRPETAQGIFVNFKNFYDFNRNKLPFAVAQLGLGFRNEISPREGLLRVREFTMAEIEHFVNPKYKNHPKFDSVSGLQIPLFTRDLQNDGQQPQVMSLFDAVASQTVDNETLGYFIGRTYLFLIELGIKPHGIRFRQHLANEMAHYAKDCWDAEILTSYGWKECVGIADRSCFDLNCHAEASKKNLQATEVYPTPIDVQFIDMRPNKGVIGGQFKQKAKFVFKYLEEMTECDKEEAMNKLQSGESLQVQIEGEQVELTPQMLNPVQSTKRLTQETFYPSVIEPSFGIGRIFYAILEHAYQERSELQEVRSYLFLPSFLSPIKCSVLPLTNNPDFRSFIREIKTGLTREGMSSEVDESSTTLGKKYARTDEIGIPYAVTIDFQTVQDRTVTLRELFSMKQVRISVDQVAKTVRKLVNRRITWADVEATYPIFTSNSQNQYRTMRGNIQLSIVKTEGFGLETPNLGCYIAVNQNLVDVVTPLDNNQSDSISIQQTNGIIEFTVKNMRHSHVTLGAVTIPLTLLPSEGFQWIPLYEENKEICELPDEVKQPRILVLVNREVVLSPVMEITEYSSEDELADNEKGMYMKNLLRQRKQLEQCVEQLESKVAEVRDGWSQESDKLNGKLKKVKFKHSQLKNQLNLKQEQVDQLNKELKAANDKLQQYTLTNIFKRFELVREENEFLLGGQSKQLKHENLKLKKELHEACNQLQNFKCSFEQLQKQIEQTNFKALNSQITELNKQNQQLLDLNRHYQTEVQSMQKQLQKNQDFKEHINILKSQLNTLNHSLISERESHDNTRQQLELYTSQYYMLKKEFSEIQDITLKDSFINTTDLSFNNRNTSHSILDRSPVQSRSPINDLDSEIQETLRSMNL